MYVDSHRSALSTSMSYPRGFNRVGPTAVGLKMREASADICAAFTNGIALADMTQRTERKTDKPWQVS